MTVEIAVGAEVVVRGLPPQVEDELTRANTFANPEYGSRERLGLRLDGTVARQGTVGLAAWRHGHPARRCITDAARYR